MAINNKSLANLRPGNGGRKKGSKTKNLKNFLLQIADSEVTIKDLQGNEITAKAAEAVSLVLFKRALKGDVRAYKEIADRIDGPVNQKDNEENAVAQTLTQINVNVIRHDASNG